MRFSDSDHVGARRCHQTLSLFVLYVDPLVMYKADLAVLDGIMVDYYGASRPLNEIANIRVESANILVIEPHDLSSLDNIEKAIPASGIDIAPENDGKCIKLSFPKITEDLRRQLVK